MAKVTLRDMVDAVRECAREHPTRVYNQTGRKDCSYAPDRDNPDGCLLGMAARKLGIDTRGWDEHGAFCNVTAAFDSPFDNDPVAAAWLDKAQSMQDSGAAFWSDCVAYADRKVTL